MSVIKQSQNIVFNTDSDNVRWDTVTNTHQIEY